MIRLKRFGRRNRPSWRIAVMDKRNARDGESLEEIGTYDNVTDPKQTRVVVKADRARYWLSVGAQPSENCARLIKKYGKDGTHLSQQAAALERIKTTRPQAPASYIPPPKPPEPEPAAEAPPAEAPPAEQPPEAPKAE